MNEISFIVPVYNARKTVKRCIQSILSQNIDKFEIIIINDGSTDDTLEILMKNFSEYDQIKIVDQKNKGVSYSRNKGIELAKYDLLAFVDADDMLKPEMYNRMLELINGGYDLAICAFELIVDSQKYNYALEECSISGIFSSADFANRFFEFLQMGLTNSNWNKLYKKQIINQYNIRFDSKLEIAEDATFNIEYFKHMNNVIITNEKLYCYVISDEQTIHKVFKNYYKKICGFYKEIKTFLEVYDAFECNRNNFFSKFCIEITNSISYIARENLTYSQKIEKINSIFLDEMYLEMLKANFKHTWKYRLLKLRNPHVILIFYIIKYWIKRKGM